jgi:hypothetical protein
MSLGSASLTASIVDRPDRLQGRTTCYNLHFYYLYFLTCMLNGRSILALISGTLSMPGVTVGDVSVLGITLVI